MYSSGTPEAGGNNSDCRTEFVTKFTKVKESTATATCNIFSAPKASRKIELGNWSVGSSEANILLITNSEGSQQKLTIKEEHPGFLFEAGKNHTITFTAESTLGLFYRFFFIF
jgi:hypothetical protein